MLWAHLVSDSSLEELHAFAAAAGIPRRGFDQDHYDVPAARWQALVEQGPNQSPSGNSWSASAAAGCASHSAKSEACETRSGSVLRLRGDDARAGARGAPRGAGTPLTRLLGFRQRAEHRVEELLGVLGVDPARGT